MKFLCKVCTQNIKLSNQLIIDFMIYNYNMSLFSSPDHCTNLMCRLCTRLICSRFDTFTLICCGFSFNKN